MILGTVVALTNVPDSAFSSEAMDKGVAIEPASEKVVSPIIVTNCSSYSAVNATQEGIASSKINGFSQ
ncbi:PTS glucose transporter subunit IIA [Planomicrobium sp. CPCC 101079]|nr:PTS glucose transporter subunit IIA [Planomicrobium sp. CPCC 101079]